MQILQGFYLFCAAYALGMNKVINNCIKLVRKKFNGVRVRKNFCRAGAFKCFAF